MKGKTMGKSYYQKKSYADQELVAYATKNNVSISSIAEKMELKDGELYSILHNPMSTARRYEIKRIIDDISEENTSNDVKDDFTIDDLLFSAKVQANNRSADRKDVYISINSAKTKYSSYEYVSFSFRNGIEKLFSSTKYANVAVYKGRIYFKEDTSFRGYKIGEVKGCTTKTMKIIQSQPELIEIVKENRGEYDLIKDERLGLYYIEVK